jgi:hypothetical protein
VSPKEDSDRRAKVLSAIMADPGVSNMTLAKATGYSKTQIQRIRQQPGITQEVKARVAAGGAGEAARGSVANLLGALAVVTDRLLDSPEFGENETVKAMQLLAGLTATLERMSRAGIDLTALASPSDTRALAGELARAYQRGAKAARKYPHARVEHWALWLVRKHSESGPLDDAKL